MKKIFLLFIFIPQILFADDPIKGDWIVVCQYSIFHGSEESNTESGFVISADFGENSFVFWNQEPGTWSRVDENKYKIVLPEHTVYLFVNPNSKDRLFMLLIGSHDLKVGDQIESDVGFISCFGKMVPKE